MPHILIVEDETIIRSALRRLLERNQYQVSEAGSVQEAQERYSIPTFDLVVSDLRLPGAPGTELIKLAEGTPVLIMTSYASLRSAVDSMKMGAVDYIAKPFDHDEMLQAVARILRDHQEAKRNPPSEAPSKSAGKGSVAAEGEIGIIGSCAAMQDLYGKIRKVAPTDSNVLIQGESGTGKELVARALHNLSKRAKAPLISVNCAAIPETLIESELFGHEKGAFTGASAGRAGLVEAADGGTLFLDEIGELPLEVQASLLRVLETGTYRRVGEKEERTVNIRFLFATNRHLAEEVERAQFNEAFFHRINAFSIQIPSLKERKEDLPLLVDYFLTTLSPDGSGGYRLVDNAMACILRYGWPGNIRELRNVIERSIILAENGIITERCLPRELVESAESGDGAALSLASVERQHILKMLEFHGGNRQQTADTLGISRKTLYRKLTEYAID